MSLRPRYSLLTLLLLTAAIAVGIKLWRGPHRFSTPGPVESTLFMYENEQEIALWRSPNYFVMTDNALQCEIPPDADSVIECEYVRQWSDYKVTTACATWKKPRHLLRVKQRDLKIRSSIILENSEHELPAWAFFMKSDEVFVTCEELYCWVAGNSNSTTIEYRSHNYPLMGPMIHFGIQLSDTGPQPVYFLTTNKKIYQLDLTTSSDRSSTEPKYGAIPVEFIEISDPQIQARLAEQLAKLRN